MASDTPTVPANVPAAFLQRVSTNAEATAKILSLVALVLYGIGLLVTNTFLAEYGISDFSIVKPQCLFTGFWSLLLLLLASLPSLSFAYTVAKREASVVKRIALGLIYFTILCYVCSGVANVLFGIVLGAPAPLDDHLAVLDIGIDGWRGLLILMSVFPVLVITGFLTRHRSSSLTERQVGVVLWLGAIIPGTVIGVLLIGYSMFETVNTEVGGGRPQNAVFYFAPEGKDILTYLRNGTHPYHDSDPPMTIEGDLIYSTSDRYVVRVTFCERDAGGSSETSSMTRKDKSVAVDKKLIQAVLFTRIPVSPVTRRCPYGVVR